MKNKIIVSLVFILPLIIYFAILSFNPDSAMEPVANAKSNHPQVIVFSTPMCGECRKMAPVIDDIKSKYSDKIDIVKVNAVDNKAETNRLVRQHKVYLVPTVIYLSRNGEVVNRTEGSLPYDELEGYVKELLEK